MWTGGWVAVATILHGWIDIWTYEKDPPTRLTDQARLKQVGSSLTGRTGRTGSGEV